MIDDEEAFCFTLHRALEAAGHEVFGASSEEEGVSQFKRMATQSRSADVVIIDILMSKKDGYNTIAEIKTISS